MIEYGKTKERTMVVQCGGNYSDDNLNPLSSGKEFMCMFCIEMELERQKNNAYQEDD